MLEFDRTLTLPNWLYRQAVLLELHYHNAYTLLQRPFTRLHYAHSSSMITSPDSWQPGVELHITSALHHATIIVDTVSMICSMSDAFYGWSEVLQPLWNAALTIVAYVSANSLSSVVPRALDSLTRAQAIFDLFSTSPSALSAKGIVQSLLDSLQNINAQGACAVANDEPMGWDLFASLLEDQETSNTSCDSVPFPSFMPSMSQISASDLMQFSDS